jgi:hypothetical protein
MIHGLPINGTPVCGQVSPGWWRDMVGAAIGIQPPMFPRTKRTRSCCASTLAGSASFDTCPEGAEDGVVHTYARSCLWHMDDELHFSILIQFLCN